MNETNRDYGTAQLPFSEASSTDSLLFISGQGGFDPVTGEIKHGDLETQTVNTMQNIAAILEKHGLTLQDLVKLTIYLSDRKLYVPFNGIYTQLLTPPFPARTVIYCDLNFDLLVEIDAVARLRTASRVTTHPD